MANRVDRWSLRRLHRAFVQSTKKHHWINVRGGERRPWLRAEQDALSDLELIVIACDSSTEASTEDDAEVPADVLDDTFADRLVTAAAALSETDRRTLAERTRAAPRRVDAATLEPWMSALVSSLRYSDGDGDETFIPEDAEALLEWDEKGRAERRPVPQVPDWARARSRRSARDVLRPYRADQSFAAGDWIQHKTFGEGLVVESTDKIRVVFESGTRTLVASSMDGSRRRS